VDLASLQAAFAKMAEADHYEVLGVARNASGAQVKAAYFALAKAWHPDSAAQDDPPEAKKLRADLFARISEAWSVLGDEARRKQYFEDLQTGAMTPVDVGAILEAENVFQKATVLVKTRQYQAALAELEKAVQLNEDEPEFLVWRAWVQFLLAADRKRQFAIASEEIEGALKKLPRCLPAYLFLGQMAKINGELSLAERHLKRGLQVDPQDPDLVRELKYLRK
jgi:curved DNA-binding protein CbpA